MIIFNPVHVIWKTSFFTIYSWGLMFIVAFIIAGLLFYLEARKKGVSQDTVLKILLVVLIGAIVGGRLFYVLENLAVFIAKPLSIFAYGQGGETSYGGIILAVLFVWLYLRKNKEINFSHVLDMTAPYLALGLAIARIGCFLNWDDFGIQSTLPWAIKVGNDFARHPTQLYELIYCGIIFGLLMWFKHIKEKGIKKVDVSGKKSVNSEEIKRINENKAHVKVEPPSICSKSNNTINLDEAKRLELSKAHEVKSSHISQESWFTKILAKRGAMFLIFLVLYSIFRFFNDFLRIYSFHWLGLATSQWLLMIVFVGSVLILAFEKTR